VAGAFLRRLSGRRDLFNDLVLLDRDEHVLENRYLDHSRLRYTFVRQDLRIGENAADYVRLLRQYQIDIVLDLTDMDTLPVFQATDAAGVSYINTALNDARAGVHQMVAAIHPTRHRPRRAPHIISSGMNPGAVNIWVMHGVRNFGVPREIIHFEYDTSTPADGWRPLITWSRQEFLTETVWEPTGQVDDGQVRVFDTNALANGRVCSRSWSRSASCRPIRRVFSSSTRRTSSSPSASASPQSTSMPCTRGRWIISCNAGANAARFSSVIWRWATTPPSR